MQIRGEKVGKVEEPKKQRASTNHFKQHFAVKHLSRKFTIVVHIYLEKINVLHLACINHSRYEFIQSFDIPL